MGNPVKLIAVERSERFVSPEECCCSNAADFYRDCRRQFHAERHFDLECNFKATGVWGGVASLVEDLWEGIRSRAPELIPRHNYELARVVPWLVDEGAGVRKTLTDAAPELERVRSYAADRASRIPHGIIDLILEWKKKSGRSDIWVLSCYDYGNAGAASQMFYAALHRRAPVDAGIKVMFGVRHSQYQEVSQALNQGAATSGPPAVMLIPDDSELSEPSGPAHWLLRTNEDGSGVSPAERIRYLSRMIAVGQVSGPTEETVKLRLFALSHYCAEGFYADALRYAQGLLEDCKKLLPEDRALQWHIAYKTLNAHLGTGNIDQASHLANTDCQLLVDGAGSRMQSNLLYLRAMIHARFIQPRDLGKGELLLAEAIRTLHPQEMTVGDYHFARVFLKNGLAMIRIFEGRREEALLLCQEGLEEMDEFVDPSSHLLHRSVLLYNAAQVYGSLADTDQAIEYLSRAIEMDPNYSEYYNDRGNLHMIRGEYSDARQDYQLAIELSPPYHEVLVNFGQCCRLQGDHLEALTHYDRALDLRPDILLAKIGRGFCLHQLSRFAEALADYDSILELDSSLWEIFSNRASLYYDLDQFDQALKDMDEAIRLNPQQAELVANRQMIFAAAQGAAC
jgi:tetratricopeptide (TPR) repeat protein